MRNKRETNDVKILFVEDDNDFGPSLEERLCKRGFDVVPVYTAQEGLRMLESTEFDVVVADLKLPEMDGIQFLECVRERFSNLPVIILTGYGSLETAKDAVRLGAADYLLKPLDILEDLLDPLDKAVRAHRLARENMRLVSEFGSSMKKLKKAEEGHRKSEKEFEEQKAKLEGKAATLNEIIQRVELEKQELKGEVHRNVETILLPLVKELRRTMSHGQERYLGMLEKGLNEIALHSARALSEWKLKLTPREIEICNMLRSGLRGKEISSALNVTYQTVERHRNNIRKKLGLVNAGVNLASYLKSL